MAYVLKGKLVKAFITAAALTGCGASEAYMAQPPTPSHPEWASNAEWGRTPEYRREIQAVRDLFDNDVNIHRMEAHARKLNCKAAFEQSAQDKPAEFAREACATRANALLLEDIGLDIEREMKGWTKVDGRYRGQYMYETGRSSGTYEPLADSEMRNELRFVCQRLILKQADGQVPGEVLPKVCNDILMPR